MARSKNLKIVLLCPAKDFEPGHAFQLPARHAQTVTTYTFKTGFPALNYPGHPVIAWRRCRESFVYSRGRYKSGCNSCWGNSVWIVVTSPLQTNTASFFSLSQSFATQISQFQNEVLRKYFIYANKNYYLGRSQSIYSEFYGFRSRLQDDYF